jgi:CheY-like chemotaxis protein
MMEQVLVNLVVNARDAMPRGGQLVVTTDGIKLEEALLELHPEGRKGEFVRLSVSDTGTGIAPEHMPHIFEPFFTTKDQGKGTGLGLATVYGIVKQHEGWIEVATGAGTGSTFNIFLPASERPEAKAAAAQVNPELGRGIERILLVEDDLAVRLLTRRILDSAGYHVWDSGNGPEALRLWRDLGGEIDLLLTDMVMPDGMTGRELAEQLQTERPQLKVIFATGYSPEVAGRDTEFVRRNKEFILQKPYSSQVLLQKLRQCLEAK